MRPVSIARAAEAFGAEIRSEAGVSELRVEVGLAGRRPPGAIASEHELPVVAVEVVDALVAAVDVHLDRVVLEREGRVRAPGVVAHREQEVEPPVVVENAEVAGEVGVPFRSADDPHPDVAEAVADALAAIAARGRDEGPR